MDVREVVQQQGERSQGLVTAAEIVAAGVSRPALSRARATGQVVRVRRRVYAVEPLPDRPRHVVTSDGVSPAYVAHVRAVLLGLGGSATACGRTAAALYGWEMLVEPGHVEVAAEHGWDARAPGVRVTQRRHVRRSRLRVVSGHEALRVTSSVQTVVDCALDRPLIEAVALCDSALRSGRVTPEALAAAVERLPGRRGADRARRMLALSDPLSGSVLESVLRVRMRLAGIEGFRSQAVLRLAPGPIRVDFCFPDAGLVVEVDGRRWHQALSRDLERDNALALLGWRVLRLSWAQVVHEPDEVLADLRAALAATPTVHLAPDAGRTAV